MRKKVTHKSGFTLIELLVAMAMSAIVLTSIYSVFISMMQTTVNETDLVDMQQEMRMAIDFMSRDIKMAGAVVSTGIGDASDATTLNLQTATNLYSYALIDTDIDATAGASSCTLSIATPSMLGDFSDGDTVRIIRPVTQAQVGSSDYYTITSVADIDDVEAGSADSEIVLGALGNTDELAIKAGDLLIPYNAGESYPATISWTLNGTSLERSLNSGSAATIVESVSSLSLDYLDESGTTTSTSADMAAVRITLAAVTDGQLNGSARERELSTIVYLRN